MKKIIKKILREQFIDNQDMNNDMKTICNKMTINDYNEAYTLIKNSLKNYDITKQKEIFNKIKTPLINLKQENDKINKEIKLYRMSGGSKLDNLDTYWHQIQTILCELGSNFKQ